MFDCMFCCVYVDVFIALWFYLYSLLPALTFRCWDAVKCDVRIDWSIYVVIFLFSVRRQMTHQFWQCVAQVKLCLSSIGKCFALWHCLVPTFQHNFQEWMWINFNNNKRQKSVLLGELSYQSCDSFLTRKFTWEKWLTALHYHLENSLKKYLYSIFTRAMRL